MGACLLLFRVIKVSVIYNKVALLMFLGFDHRCMDIWTDRQFKLSLELVKCNGSEIAWSMKIHVIMCEV